MRAILTYHSLDDSPSPISVPAAAFRAQMTWLAAEGIPVVDLAALAHLGPGATAVAITFDDGFRNFMTEALPLLRDHGYPASVFVVTGRVGQDNAWGPPGAVPVLPLMTWDELGTCHEAGVRLESHTVTHRRLSPLSAGAVADEVGSSMEALLRETGRRPTAFAYPYGDHTPAVRATVAHHVPLACATTYAALDDRPDAHALPRIDAVYARRRGHLPVGDSSLARSRLWCRRQARRLRQWTRGEAVLG